MDSGPITRMRCQRCDVVLVNPSWHNTAPDCSGVRLFHFPQGVPCGPLVTVVES
jgi:hypothetical protein